MKSPKRSIKKTKRSPKNKCEYPVTMHGLKLWFQRMFETLGWMVLAKKKGYTEKLIAYKKSLLRLCEKIECKIETVSSEDKKKDLKIMINDALELVRHVRKDFR